MQPQKYRDTESPVAADLYIETAQIGDMYGVPVGCALPKSYLITKRIFDVTSSVLLLLVIWLAFVIIAIAVKIDSKGPVFFKHKRIGQHGKTISIYKFRTMKRGAEEMIQNFTPEQMEAWKKNYKLKNDPRVTRLGRFLRRSSLDELPQLIDIVRGTLSVVGPRPIIEEELEKYGENKDKFLSVRPGLTGYWQAYARSECSYEQRMEMELFYINNASFGWDMRILCKTLIEVFRKTGAI